MAKTTKVNVNNNELNKVITNLENASDLVGSAKSLNNSKIAKYSKLKADDQINNALEYLISCLSLEDKVISLCTDSVKKMQKTIKKFDEKKSIKQKIKKNLNAKNEEKLKKNYESLVGLIGAKKAKKYVEGLGLGSKVKFSKDAKSIIGLKKKKTTNITKTTSNKAVVTTNKSVTNDSRSNTIKQTNAKTTKKTNSKTATVASLKKDLKNALKNGKSKKASKYYQLLVTAIGAKKTNKYLNRLGYDKNLQKKYIEEEISSITNKIQDKKSDTNNSNTTNDKRVNIIEKNDDRKPNIFENFNNNEQNKPNDDLTTIPDDTQNNIPNDKQDNMPNSNNSNNNSNNIIQGDNKDDVVATITPSKPEDNNNSNNEVVNNYYDSSDSDDYDYYDSEIEDSHIEENRVSETPIEQTEKDIVDDDLTDIDEDKSSKNKVITIDEEEEIENSNKNSSNLGVAVPLGLGAIATGAAAVAGVRYVKNKHNNSEEYIDDYEEDEEENDYNIESEYIDSAQYENDSKDDIYKGPAGSNYMNTEGLEEIDNLDENSKSNNYIDPSIIDDEEDIEDLALDELNSGLYNV